MKAYKKIEISIIDMSDKDVIRTSSVGNPDYDNVERDIEWGTIQEATV